MHWAGLAVVVMALAWWVGYRWVNRPWPDDE